MITYNSAALLPAGRALDSYITSCLDRIGYPFMERARKAAWSSDARQVCTLIDILTSPVFMTTAWSITFECSAAHTQKWQCRIEADDWFCEACGETLSLAFCRAFIQEQGAS